MTNILSALAFALLFSAEGFAASDCDKAKENGPAKAASQCRDYVEKPEWVELHACVDSCTGGAGAKAGADKWNMCSNKCDPERQKGRKAENEWKGKWGALEYLCDKDKSRRLNARCPDHRPMATGAPTLVLKNASQPSDDAKKAVPKGYVCPEDNRMFTSADFAANCDKADATAKPKNAADAQQKSAAGNGGRPAADKAQQEKDAAEMKKRQQIEDKKVADVLEESKKRHNCKVTVTKTGSANTEAESRAQIHLLPPGATGKNAIGDPYRVVSMSVTCTREATNINPKYDCVGKQVSEVSMVGGCGSSATTKGTSR